MGTILQTPAGRIHLDARRIVALRKALNNLNYTEWKDWHSFGSDNTAKWMAIAFGLIMVRSKRYKTKTQTIFTRMVKLNSDKKPEIDALGVKVQEYFIKKKEQTIKKIETKSISEDDFMDSVLETV